jgi:hypothetical protein
MINDRDKNEKEKDHSKNHPIEPDPETLNTTDPQEHMQGPVSSLMQDMGEDFDHKDQKKQNKKN